MPAILKCYISFPKIVYKTRTSLNISVIYSKYSLYYQPVISSTSERSFGKLSKTYLRSTTVLSFINNQSIISPEKINCNTYLLLRYY